MFACVKPCISVLAHVCDSSIYYPAVFFGQMLVSDFVPHHEWFLIIPDRYIATSFTILWPKPMGESQIRLYINIFVSILTTCANLFRIFVIVTWSVKDLVQKLAIDTFPKPGYITEILSY